jgi:hypothetical protein
MKEALNEEAFIQQYVLQRATLSRTSLFDVKGAARRGKEAYEYIQSITKTKDQQQQ